MYFSVVTSDYFPHTKLRIFIQSKHRPLVNHIGNANKYENKSNKSIPASSQRQRDASMYDYNVFGLTDSELSERVIVPIDISKQPEKDKYIPEEDPSKFISADTGLGKVNHYIRDFLTRFLLLSAMFLYFSCNSNTLLCHYSVDQRMATAYESSDGMLQACPGGLQVLGASVQSGECYCQQPGILIS